VKEFNEGRMVARGHEGSGEGGRWGEKACSNYWECVKHGEGAEDGGRGGGREHGLGSVCEEGKALKRRGGKVGREGRGGGENKTGGGGRKSERGGEERENEGRSGAQRGSGVKKRLRGQGRGRREEGRVHGKVEGRGWDTQSVGGGGGGRREAGVGRWRRTLRIPILGSEVLTNERPKVIFSIHRWDSKDWWGIRGETKKYSPNYKCG